MLSANNLQTLAIPQHILDYVPLLSRTVNTTIDCPAHLNAEIEIYGQDRRGYTCKSFSSFSKFSCLKKFLLANESYDVLQLIDNKREKLLQKINKKELMLYTLYKNQKLKSLKFVLLLESPVMSKCYESQIAPNAGIPLLSIPYTTFLVSFWLEIQTTASAPNFLTSE